MGNQVDIINRWFSEGVNGGNLSVVDELFAPDVVAHEPQGEVTGRDEGPRRAIEGIRAGFPDFKATVEDVISNGDRVVVRWTATGTHTGEFMEVPRTGRVIKFSAIYIYRIADGRIAEVWASPDALGLMKQLGL